MQDFFNCPTDILCTYSYNRCNRCVSGNNGRGRTLTDRRSLHSWICAILWLTWCTAKLYWSFSFATYKWYWERIYWGTNLDVDILATRHCWNRQDYAFYNLSILLSQLLSTTKLRCYADTTKINRSTVSDTTCFGSVISATLTKLLSNMYPS